MTSAGAPIRRSAEIVVFIPTPFDGHSQVYHMVHVPDGTLRSMRKQELLEAVVAELARSGIGDRSLRDIAAAVGTSHRMLLHHFGSRDELLLAIVEQVERRQMTRLRELPTEPAAAIAEMWADLRRTELRPFERLFFECYARGVQGEQPFARMHPAAVDGWLEAQSTKLDPALMRLGLA